MKDLDSLGIKDSVYLREIESKDGLWVTWVVGVVARGQIRGNFSHGFHG